MGTKLNQALPVRPTRGCCFLVYRGIHASTVEVSYSFMVNNLDVLVTRFFLLVSQVLGHINIASRDTCTSSATLSTLPWCAHVRAIIPLENEQFGVIRYSSTTAKQIAFHVSTNHAATLGRGCLQK